MALSIGELYATLEIRSEGIIDTFSKFERTMNFVQVVTDATGQQFEELQKKAMEMGNASQFGATASAEAMKILAQAGFEVHEVMAALPQVLQLASSAQIGVAESTDIVTGILRGYGKDVSELGHINDVLVTTFQKTNSELTDLGVAFRYVGPIAKSAGISFEETAAAIGILSNAGIKGSMAGTSLRGAISRLLDPSKEAAAVIKDLGLKVTDSEGRLKSLSDIVQQLEPHAHKTADFMTIFGQRAGPAMAALVNQGSASLIKLTEQVTNSGGAAQKVADVQMRGLQGAMNSLNNALENVRISIGERFAPAIEGIIELMTDWVRAFQELPPGVQDTIVQVTLLGTAAVTLTGLVVTLNAALALTNTVLGVSLLPIIGSVVAAIATFVVVKEVTDWFLDLHPAIRKVADVLVDMMLNISVVGPALRLYNAHLEKGKDVMAGWTDQQKAAFAEVQRNSAVAATQGEALARLGVSTKAVTVETGGMTEAVKSWSTADIAEKMKSIDNADKLAKATQLVGEEIDSLPQAERIIAYAAAQDEAAKKAQKHQENLVKLKDTYTEILNIMTSAQGTALVQGFGSGFKIPDMPALQGESKGTEGLLGPLISGLPNAMEQASKLLADGFTVKTVKEKLMEGLKLSATEAEGVLAALGKKLGDRSFGQQLGDSLKGAFKNLPNAILGAIQGGGDVGKAVGASMGGDIVGGIFKEGGKATEFLTDKLGNTLGGTISGFMGPLGSMAGSLIGGLVGKGIGKINAALGIGGNKEIMALNDTRDKFFESMGGFEELQKKLVGLSNQDLVKKIFDAKTVEQFNAAVNEVNALLGNQEMAQQALNDAIERYGFTLEELPAKMRQDELNAGFGQLLQDFELLKAAGFEVGVILEKMAPSMNEFVNSAIASGATIPEAMRPIIEQMIAQGLLLDSNGEAYESVEDAGITFAQTMDEKFTTLIDKITQMVNALLGLPSDVNTNINVNTNYTSSGDTSQGGRGTPWDDEFAEGGIVTSPTIGLFGEGGAEALVPLDELSMMNRREDGPQTAELSPASARLIAKSVRDAMLQNV